MLSWNLLCRPCWSGTQERFTCFCFLSAGIKDMGSKDQRVNENHLSALHLGHSHMQVTFPPAEICGWNEDSGYWQFGAITLSPALAPVVFLATASMPSVWREMKLYQVTYEIQKVTHVLGVVVHTFSPQHQGSRAEESEFKASLLYLVSPRSPRSTQKDPVSKKKTLTKLFTLRMCSTAVSAAE